MDELFYTANFDVVVPNQLVLRVVGKDLYKEFEESIEQVTTVFGDGVLVDERTHELKLAEIIAECPQEYKAYVKVRRRLEATFKKATGLKLTRKNHAAEDYGSENDDVEGCYWALEFDQAFKPSPALQALNKKAGRSPKVYLANYCYWR